MKTKSVLSAMFGMVLACGMLFTGCGDGAGNGNPFVGTWFNDAVTEGTQMPAKMAKLIISENDFTESLIPNAQGNTYMNLMKGTVTSTSSLATFTVTHGWVSGIWDDDFSKTLDAASQTINSMLSNNTTFTATIVNGKLLANGMYFSKE
ncbi:MAG: hypothetical protein LBQ46_04020 [Treponema sp.]|jgi:hypothetical protein|nr:hypothetical protein [Treponema sp.]